MRVLQRWCFTWLGFLLGVGFSTGVQADAVIFPVGSSFGLIPPAGYELSKDFPGFVNGAAKASILFTELPANAYPQILKGLDDGPLKQQGYEAVRREPFTARMGIGVLVTGDQVVKGVASRKWIFAVPAVKVAALVSVTVPQREVESSTDAAVRQALASLSLSQAADPIVEEELSFKFRAAGRLQSYQTVQGKAVLLIPAGAQPSSATPNLLIVDASGAPLHAEAWRSFAERALNSLQVLTEVAIESVAEYEHGGRPGLRIEGRAVEAATGAPLRLRQWLVFYPQGRYLRALALAPQSEFDTYAPEFEAIAASLRRR